MAYKQNSPLKQQTGEKIPVRGAGYAGYSIGIGTGNYRAGNLDSHADARAIALNKSYSDSNKNIKNALPDSYEGVYGIKKATLGNYFKGFKDQFSKTKEKIQEYRAKKLSAESNTEPAKVGKDFDESAITSNNTAPGLMGDGQKPGSVLESDNITPATELAKKSLSSPMTPEEVEKARPKGNIESKLNPNSVKSSESSRIEAHLYGTPPLSPTEGSDYRFNLKPGTTRTTSGMSAIEGNAEMGRRNFRNQQVERDNDWEEGGLIGKVTDQTEVEGIGDSGVFQKSDAYGKAMMRSGLYQKSYNAKKYK